jgi:hypothetical protein
MPPEYETSRRQSAGLVDLLDRVLDKGLVIAGDVKISLAEVELLTIRVRLLVCSVDKALQIGLDWWKHDKHLSAAGHGLVQENEALKEQVRKLEERLAEREPPRRRLPNGNGTTRRVAARRRAK